MITKKHYTLDGRHPEDAIYKERMLIQEFQRMLDRRFENLAQDLRLTEEGENLLFDYIYNNGDEDIEFEDYLSRLDVDYSEIFKK